MHTYKDFNRIRFPIAGMRTAYSVAAHVARGGRVERDTTAPRMCEDQGAVPARAAPREAENFFEKPAHPEHRDGQNWWRSMADRRKAWYENWYKGAIEQARRHRPEDDSDEQTLWDEIEKEMERAANPQTR